MLANRFAAYGGHMRFQTFSSKLGLSSGRLVTGLARLGIELALVRVPLFAGHVAMFGRL